MTKKRVSLICFLPVFTKWSIGCIRQKWCTYLKNIYWIYAIGSTTHSTIRLPDTTQRKTLISVAYYFVKLLFWLKFSMLGVCCGMFFWGKSFSQSILFNWWDKAKGNIYLAKLRPSQRSAGGGDGWGTSSLSLSYERWRCQVFGLLIENSEKTDGGGVGNGTKVRRSTWGTQLSDLLVCQYHAIW